MQKDDGFLSISFTGRMQSCINDEPAREGFPSPSSCIMEVITHEADVHSRSFRWRVPVYQLSTARSGDAGLGSGPCEFRRRGGHKGFSCTSGCAQDRASNGTSPILSEPETHMGKCCASLTRRSATPRSNVNQRSGNHILGIARARRSCRLCHYCLQ